MEVARTRDEPALRLSRESSLATVFAPSLVPGLLATGLFVLWAGAEAGYAQEQWYPGALFVLAVLVVVALCHRGAFRRMPTPVLAAVGFLGAYTAWSFASISWAGAKGDAWDGANRTLLYLAIFTLFAAVPWRAVTAAMLMGIFSLAVAGIGAYAFLEATTSANPLRYFVEGRLSAPVSYANASCALFMIAFWPALLLAGRKETPWPLRGVLLASAGCLLELAILTQSRALLFAGPVAAVFCLAFVPGRFRTLACLAPIGAVAAWFWLPPLHRIYVDATSGGHVHLALVDGRTALVRSAVALFVVGTTLAACDRWLRVSPRLARRVDRAVLGGLGLAVVAGVVALFLSHPVGMAERAWSEFKANADTPASSHLTSGLGSSRYDIWRVALDDFRNAPVQGAGADNFAQSYLRARRTAHEPLYPHSLELRLLSQTGLVGTGLFLAFLVFAVVAVRRRRREGRREGAGWEAVVISGALVPFVYWLAHGSFDWFWEFPGLTAPVLAWLAMAARIGRRTDDDPPGERVPRARLGIILAIAVCALALAATSLALPLVAQRDTAQALEVWRTNPAKAFALLDRARSYNFLGDQPDLVAGAIASRIGDPGRMRASFERAIQRNPGGWYARLELAAGDALAHRRAAALAEARVARRLNPREPAIRLVIARLHAGKPVSPRVLDRIFLERVDQLLR